MFKSFTVNRANWSGEQGTIEYCDAGAFLIEDIDGIFAMVRDADCALPCYIVTHKEYGIYRGFIFDSPYGERVLFSDGNVNRSHQNPLIAFARLAWSLF